MNKIMIRPMTIKDIPTWMTLSHEYDNYVKELVPDLVQWYEGNDTDMAFGDYMKAKIKQQEAFMAINKENKACLGIIALSHTYNRINFFWYFSYQIL